MASASAPHLLSSLAAEPAEPEVYEYDPPPSAALPAPPPPPSAAEAGGEAGVAADADVADVVAYTLDARGSFEVFMGRRYDPAEGPGGLGGGGSREGGAASAASAAAAAGDADSLLVSQRPLFPSHAAFDAFARHVSAKIEAGLPGSGAAAGAGAGAGAGGGGRRRAAGGGGALPRRLESPLERYARLVDEVRELQTELRAVAESDRRRAPGTTAVDHASGVFRLLTAGSAEVEGQLQALASTAARATSSSAAAAAAAAGASRAHADADAVAAADASSPAAALGALRALQADVGALKLAQSEAARAGEAVRAGVAAVEQRLHRFLALAVPAPRPSGAGE
jgi:hypothetical protein